MANMNVRKRLEAISNDLDAVLKHVSQYSGVDAKEALFIDNVATGIAEAASILAAEARRVSGNRSAASLRKNVRKALGFTKP
jgi:prophage DNA circulation protein